MPEGVAPTATVPPRRRDRFALVLAVREVPSASLRAAVLSIAVVMGMAISAGVLILAGVPAADLADEFLAGTLADPQSLAAVLAQAAPLILMGVGGALAFRVNFWNLGLEGQMIAGAIATTWVALHGGGLAAMAVAAGLGGLAWALLPAALRLRLGVNEIIATLLLNYIAQNLLLYLVYGPWQDPIDSFPHSPAFPPGARLPQIAVEWFSFSAALPVALAAAAAAGWLAGGTRLGQYMRVVQANPRMARAVGVPVRATMFAAILASATAAGLGGFCLTAGEEGRLTQSFFAGYGFSGILIAFMARNSPWAVVPVALALAWLFVTGQNLQVFYQVPFAMVQLIQAIIVICVAASEFAVRHRVRWVR